MVKWCESHKETIVSIKQENSNLLSTTTHLGVLQPINKMTIVFFYYNSNYKFMLMIA